MFRPPSPYRYPPDHGPAPVLYMFGYNRGTLWGFYWSGTPSFWLQNGFGFCPRRKFLSGCQKLVPILIIISYWRAFFAEVRYGGAKKSFSLQEIWLRGRAPGRNTAGPNLKQALILAIRSCFLMPMLIVLRNFPRRAGSWKQRPRWLNQF